MRSILDDYYLPEEALGESFLIARRFLDFIQTNFPPKNVTMARELINTAIVAIAWLEVAFYEQPYTWRHFGAVGDYIRNMRKEIEKIDEEIRVICRVKFKKTAL